MFRRHSTLEPATHIVTTSRLTCLIRGCTRKTAFDPTNAIKEQREDWEKKMMVNGARRSKLGQVRKSWLWGKHAWRYSGLYSVSILLLFLLPAFPSLPHHLLSVCLSVFFTLSLCENQVTMLAYPPHHMFVILHVSYKFTCLTLHPKILCY